MFYAKQHPRGFANEINIIRFPSRCERDAWVDGEGVEAIPAREAQALLRKQNDDLTDWYVTLWDADSDEPICY